MSIIMSMPIIVSPKLTIRRSGMMLGVLTSLCRISLSLEPELRESPFQARAPTRAL